MMIQSASHTVTSGSTFVVANAIKTSIATAASPAVYTGSGINGSIGHTVMSMPRQISVTLSSNSGSYVNGSNITIIGLDAYGKTYQETVQISGTGGGTVLYTTGFFSQVTEIDIDAQTNTGGAFQFGVNDAVIPGGAVELRVGSSGNLHVKYTDGTTDFIPSVQVGESIPAQVSRIYGDTTTAGSITAYVA